MGLRGGIENGTLHYLTFLALKILENSMYKAVISKKDQEVDRFRLLRLSCLPGHDRETIPMASVYSAMITGQLLYEHHSKTFTPKWVKSFEESC